MTNFNKTNDQFLTVQVLHKLRYNINRIQQQQHYCSLVYQTFAYLLNKRRLRSLSRLAGWRHFEIGDIRLTDLKCTTTLPTLNQKKGFETRRWSTLSVANALIQIAQQRTT